MVLILVDGSFLPVVVGHVSCQRRFVTGLECPWLAKIAFDVTFMERVVESLI